MNELNALRPNSVVKRRRIKTNRLTRRKLELNAILWSLGHLLAERAQSVRSLFPLGKQVLEAGRIDPVGLRQFRDLQVLEPLPRNMPSYSAVGAGTQRLYAVSLSANQEVQTAGSGDFNDRTLTQHPDLFSVRDVFVSELHSPKIAGGSSGF
jgi:hypothetical protein